MSAVTAGNAQIFQSIFPGGGANDAARGGVLQTRDGGTISVGESQSFGNGDYDIYVVKTDRCGFLQWATTYDIGGHDIGRKIRQTDDGYIIVGSTQNTNSCCSGPSIGPILRPTNDIFLLKIDDNGGVQWAKTYGGRRNDEGADVQLYEGGYVVAGRTSSFCLGRVAGYLMRTDLSGNVIWGRPYGEGVEFFNACTVASNGDILAVGGSSTYTNVTNIFAVRVNANGQFGWARIYPFKGEGVGRDIITAVKETFVIAGYITSPEYGNRDGYILRIDGTGARVTDRGYAEAYRKFDDEIAEVQEVPSLGYGLVLTGYLTDAPGGFGGRDLLLGEVDFDLNPGWFSLHGGAGFDEGFSVAMTPQDDLKKPVITANGVTTSFTKAGDEDLYLVQALREGKSGCNDTRPKVEVYEVGLDPKEVSFCVPLAITQCVAKVPVSYNERYRNLCSSCEPPLRQQQDPSLGQGDRQLREMRGDMRNALPGDSRMAPGVTVDSDLER